MRALGVMLSGFVAACGGATPAPVTKAEPPPAPTTPAPAAMLPTNETTLDVGDGVTLALRIVGKRGAESTIVALHGGPGLSHHYLRALEVLASDSVRFVTYDQRGAGSSTESSSRELGFEAHAHDLEQLRLALGSTTKLDVIAHSYGGLVAMAYAVQYPQHVRSLIFVGSMPPKFNDYNAGIYYFNEAIGVAQRAKELPDPLPEPEGDDCSKQLIALLPMYFHDRNHPMTKHLAGSTCKQGVFERMVKANEWYDFTDALAPLEIPTLVVHGTADPFTQQMANAIVAAMKASKPKLEILERCGHVPFEECPDRFYPAVRAFLVARP